MVRNRTQYACQECGATSPKWAGRCGQCGAWNTLHEQEIAPERAASTHRFAALAPTGGVQQLDQVAAAEVPRHPTGSEEFDRVLGGGLVPGAVVLIGGDPGIGSGGNRQVRR